MLNIKNPETHRLAKELAELTGKSMTQAVTDALALQVRVERSLATAKGARQSRGEKLREIGRRFVALEGRPFLSTHHGELLYDEDGLPT